MAVLNFNGALRTYLLADATLADLVAQRIYAVPAPQNATEPYVVIQRISKNPLSNLSGSDNVVVDRWQIDAYALTIDSAEAIAKAIFDRLQLKNHETWSGYKVYSAKFDNENYFPEPFGNGSEQMYHRIQQDFMIKHQYEI